MGRALRLGAEASLPMLAHRLTPYLGFGGVDAWRPDYLNYPGQLSHSFDENWLLGSSAGTRVALDRKGRLWLGGGARYVDNLGYKSQFGKPQVHWNTFAGSLKFLLDH